MANPTLRTLLLVEDHAPIADLVEAWVTQTWPAVQLVRVGLLADALETLKTAQSSVDLIILDLGLPDARELEALDAIMATMQGQIPRPVVILTGRTWEERTALLRHGADDMVLKQDKNVKADLLDAIRAGWERYCYRQRILQVVREATRS